MLPSSFLRAERWGAMTDEGPEQGALFCIEGPDEDGCVWICSSKGRDVWCQNLGPAAKVAEALSQWLNDQGLTSRGWRREATEMDDEEARQRDA